MELDLTACDDIARQSLVDLLYDVDELGIVRQKSVDYVARTFPSILLDVVRLFVEQATRSAREAGDPTAIKHQLRPYLMFKLLLGKCPQITGLMYSYFENSSFQPFPDKLFQFNTQENRVDYRYEGFTDELVTEILLSYLKYLTFNPKWFSAVWNWRELGRFITVHNNLDIRYLATCCLSIITRPTRPQHMSIMLETLANEQHLIDLQIKHCGIYANSFKPCIETKQKMAEQYAKLVGFSNSGYSFCSESIAGFFNILLLKRDIISRDKQTILSRCKDVIESYVPIISLRDTISKIAYSISINKPCLLKGPCGSGKTAIIDYIAAQTNRLNPPEYVKVQIGDQIDSKLLIGSYICTEIPGQFEWQPGPLTKAMAYGSWIVFEDIDSAPADMAQVLHSVIENGNLSCVSCCPIKLDSPHPEFRIFFTQRSNQSNFTDSFIERQCDIIELPLLSGDDLRNVIETRYKFGKLTEIIVQLYEKADEAITNVQLNRAVRNISLRDLFKLCDRLSTNKFQRSAEKYTSAEIESIFIDAIECFLSSLPKNKLQIPAEALGEVVNLPSNEVQRLIFLKRPEIREEKGSLVIGRTALRINSLDTSSAIRSRSTMAFTQQSLQLLESISVCIQRCEPVLLVGETGVGKTSIIQHLAASTKTQLVVVNLSQQSDSSDLLGGFKPVEMREVIRPMNNCFEELFKSTFDVKSNRTFLQHVSNCFFSAKTNSQWSTYLRLVGKLCTKALSRGDANQISEGHANKWRDLHDKTRRLAKRVAAVKESPMALAFSDGSLLRAVKDGSWILLDEINLAEPDVLQCLLLILDSIGRSQLHMLNPDEDDRPIKIHPNFRIFACMNPSTDIGKRDLVPGTRARFSEFFVDDVMEKTDLRLIVESYVKTCLSPCQIESIVNFYLEVRDRSGTLSDISGNSPVYSLRTLCRALSICADNICRNMEKSLFESLKITFLQQLNAISINNVQKLIEQTIFDKNTVTSLEEMKIPRTKDDHAYSEVGGFWIQRSNEPQSIDSKYIVTKSVTKNLQSLARIISLSQRRLPILIQGNTSVGKTSLIMYLAKISGNKCYRINNHEHTDLQEYVGRYVLRESGDLFFQEGLLVRAMKKGYWIILDELNLAPCELLEALNRVLDENRELFIPETREIIKAHSKFMLFATQNPPEEYAGRKLLSRAFRNRFVELHFDEIAHEELEMILHSRCEMPHQYASKIVSVMRELQILRRESGCFSGKNGFMTLRDLFRWGERYATFKNEVPDDQFFEWDKFVASEGLILLEGRVRTLSEADTVKSIIEKVFKCKLDRDAIYDRQFVDTSILPPQFKHVYFSTEFRKLFVQLSSALKYKEPVLLCGQTGCGKTTACQLYAALKKQEIRIYNCHLNSEGADFVGGIRPSRGKDWESGKRQMFPWVNGPLVESMTNGDLFLMDEISLADDAVLERINSVLEPARSITLTERDGEEIFARDMFRIVATMNPGGDYGKKELSPALCNRFTEIYCHNTTDIDQMTKMIENCLSPPLLKHKLLSKLMDVMHRFLKKYYSQRGFISIRDVLSWVEFINKTVQVAQPRPLSIQEAIINGASLVFFDQIGTCGHKTTTMTEDKEFKTLMKANLINLVDLKFGSTAVYSEEIPKILVINLDIVKFKKFCLLKGPLPLFESTTRDFVLDAPTVSRNVLKIVRAMQLDRPILLEGDPGAGKTSVITALAKLTGHKLVRINLSEQTDISDLFGSDLPDMENSDDDNPRFCWHDGPMLTAIKNSEWVLLDEMNLASQSVLEGLNACFDHRSEFYIPELDKTFKIDRSSTRIFACQNPYSQGSARKGLPQSFLNRFTSIYIDPYSPQDLILIVTKLYPNLPSDLINKMVKFNNEIGKCIQSTGQEFNLRDISYWCDLLTYYVRGTEFKSLNLYKPEKFVQFVYMDRLRTSTQKQKLSDLFESIFGIPAYEPPYRDIRLGEHSFIMARAIIARKARPSPQLPELCILKYQMPFMESIAKAIEFKKMPILVGESGVGKRSMIRILAGLTGNELNIIGANRDMDTIEILGSFEQKSLQREIVDLVEEAKCCVTKMINSISQKQHASTWTQLFGHIWAALYSTSLRDLKLSRSKMMDAYRLQLSQMRELIDKIQPLSGHDTAEKCKSLSEKINNLTRRSLYYSESMYSSGNFEWIDSVLVKSIREGAWLMIENANLLNPATLDRLNSLVEPKGTLCLNEKGSSKDGLEVLKPHPDFRLILTMDPKHGELSRAMRNRGVEIFVQTRFYFEDFLMLLNQNGFEPEQNKACMTYCIMQSSYDFHKTITGESPEEDGSLLAYFGLNYIPALTNQVRRGMTIDDILSELLCAFYSRKNFAEECSDAVAKNFVKQQMDQYRDIYKVDLLGERYEWRHLRHDLVALTGGDAIIGMLERDHRIFYDDSAGSLLKPEEMIQGFSFVNTCTMVKIFLDMSTHGDFDYRKAFIQNAFGAHDQMMKVVSRHIDLLRNEYIPLIKNLLPESSLTPASEIYVDSRHSPDIHYYLQSNDYQGTLKREGLQNRWLLSLHRIMLRMIVDLVEWDSKSVPGSTSLWNESERVRTGDMFKENLIRPNAEIATDLYDLLNGLLRVVSNRCYDDQTVSRMLPRFFWITYFICKLRRYHTPKELIAICNQIPMLWALTYQKVVTPIIEDCGVYDLSYKNKKFSHRIEHICDFLDITITKPGQIEKAYYKKVVNLFASTKKQCEVVNREADKFFASLVGRCTARSSSLSLDSDNIDAVGSGKIWSNSPFMSQLYEIEDELLTLGMAEKMTEEAIFEADSNRIVEDNREKIKALHLELEKPLGKERDRSRTFFQRKNFLDQFAPIWQFKLIRSQLANMSSSIADPTDYRRRLRQIIDGINGLIVSPRYYAALIKYLQKLNDRKESLLGSTLNAYQSKNQIAKTLREDVNMYTAFLTAHFIENSVLDHQVVGWTKSRVTTSDLPALAPLIPEYSPIVSLVSSYCLDINHLKLNSSLSSTDQLDSMLLYLWTNYVPIKLNADKNTHDLDLARNLIHLRTKLDDREELIGTYQCERVGADDCGCVEEYIRRRMTSYDKLIDTLQSRLPVEDLEVILKSVKIIYFGQLNYLEHAPIFTLDPSLRSREKLDVYRSELAHVKLDLHCRNTLFYWNTGENLQLNEIDAEGASCYPFSIRILVERRVKLEKSINKLRREHTFRPKSDDGLLYFDLRKDVEVNMKHHTTSINLLINDLVAYAVSDSRTKSTRFTHLVTKCRMLIKNLEKSITKFQNDYALYTDLITNYQAGMCFVLQGLRCLYARLEQRMQILEYGFSNSIYKYYDDTSRVFSFLNFAQGNIESVHKKLEFFNRLDRVCPPDRVSYMQSLMLHTVLHQLNHHITITPSDIEKCIPIVRNIADLFHAAWLERKLYLEEQRKLKEELYHYKTSTTTIGAEVSYDRQEFLDLCTKFPTYDHIYQEHSAALLTSAVKENLETEEKVINLNRSVDLSVCIDICKAHYKFTKEASRNLLGQLDVSKIDNLPEINLNQLVKMEAEMFYGVIRHCIPTLDRTYDAQAVECHLLQAHQLRKIFRQTTPDQVQLGSLKSSIEILDENIFDIYHHANACEALKFQQFIADLNCRISALVSKESGSNYSGHSTLREMSKLTTRISSFLISDPLMKFVTGSHSLLEKIEQWNRQNIPKDDKLIGETDQLIALIESWRKIEYQSWKSSLHRVKKKHIDGSLCDLWFKLYEAFNNPILFVRNFLRERTGDDEFIMGPEHAELIYIGFASFIKDFFEESTLGDYQIRLDLVFSFAIQMRFAGLYEQARPNYSKHLTEQEKCLEVDFDKLTCYVYNTYRQYHGLLAPVKGHLEEEERRLEKELNTEMKIVYWQSLKNLWEIKNQFRNSHRKLNKVMNKYLEVLRRPVPGQRPDKNISADIELNRISDKESDSERICITLVGIQLLVNEVSLPPTDSSVMKSLHKAPIIVKKMKELYNTLHEPMSNRYVDNLVSIEQCLKRNTDAVQNFHKFKVEEVVIDDKDTKEIKANKHKLCRQIYHSKKFAMQSVFKDLRDLGVSHQRGLNCADRLDTQVLSLEPLRGMIQNQSKLVLKAASCLVDDKIIVTCNEQYRSLIASNMFLLSQPNGQDLSGDQISRIRGLALDMVLDIIKQNRSAAFIYKHLMDIQAATTRLTEMQKLSNTDGMIIYNFSRVQKAIQQFNDLVGRAYLFVAKLEELSNCRVVVPTVDNQLTEAESLNNETVVLRQLLGDSNENNSLMTEQQHHIIKTHLLEVRKSIAEVSRELRDMLNCTIKNHMYSNDDQAHLECLYDKFYGSFSKLIKSESDDGLANIQRGTVLGSLKSLLEEAQCKLKPSLDEAFARDNPSQEIRVSEHPNLTKLNLRLKKLIRQIMLAVQGICHEESNHNQQQAGDGGSFLKSFSESAKRKLKPFNSIDSDAIKNLLRLNHVATHTGNCFMTLNRERHCTNIKPLVNGLTPILYIYTQDVASYLNIILTSLHLKLNVANQLIPFFTDLVLNGFGLPYKLDGDSNGTETTKGKSSDDNVGFGEGQGETDVSKKLEFESQLDDLKGKEDNADKEKEDEPIEAHDDGVEMTDDIDAEANGPDEKDKQNGKPDDEEEDDEEPDDTNELDKELDRVDEDDGEGKLDEKLWGDQDDQIEEDDEQDLRETECDSSSKPDGEADLKAKDEALADTNKDNSADEEKVDSTQDVSDDKMDIAPEDRENSQESTIDEELDMSVEAEQALNRDAEAIENSKPADEEEVIDLTNSDDEQDQMDQDDSNEKEEPDSSNNQDVREKSDGELTEDEAEAEVKSPNPHNMTLNDEDIDYQLEVAFRRPSLDDDIVNPIEETIRHMTAEAQDNGGPEESSHTMEGRKLGRHNVYDIMEEEDDDPLDCGDEPTQQNDNQEEVDPPNTRESVKRSLADQNSADQAEIKRQRILSASEDKPEMEEQDEQEDQAESKQVKSSRKGRDECIDLTSNPSECQKESLGDEDTELTLSSISGETITDDYDSMDANQMWFECNKRTGALVHELCQQLQIVLQPTKMTKYKGDYKSGKRLNMRKIISYIASHYRKDKIWMRRTKPSKRTYNICLAVDNSSSMAENNCRQMTYQSLSLLANALSLIEAGSLNVVSFGERVNCIHEFGQPYVDALGAQWLKDLRFNDTKTSYKMLLEHSCKSFAEQARSADFQQQLSPVSQLLIIISDGRNVTSEEEEVKSYLKELKSMRVLTLFVIIDDLQRNDGKSIVDVKRCVGFGANIRMLSYMELFPFPYYVLLRELETMPIMLGDALRQWFELVSNGL